MTYLQGPFLPPRALAIDSQNKVFLAWGNRYSNPQLQLMQRTAGVTATWQTLEVDIDSSQDDGLDLVVDQEGMPQAITQDSYERAEIAVNGVPLTNDNEDNSYPSIATGPRGALLAVWQRSGESTLYHERLYYATRPPETKRYFVPSTGSGRGGDQQIAMRVEGELYSTLPDPTGTFLLIVDTEGITVGHVLYDPYGQVIESELTPELKEALVRAGGAEPYTDLVHLGQGRWYDPELGRALQPDPIGGPPTVPQALNRYAATSLGQPGVMEGELSNPYTSALWHQAPGVLAGRFNSIDSTDAFLGSWLRDN